MVAYLFLFKQCNVLQCQQLCSVCCYLSLKWPNHHRDRVQLGASSAGSDWSGGPGLFCHRLPVPLTSSPHSVMLCVRCCYITASISLSCVPSADCSLADMIPPASDVKSAEHVKHEYVLIHSKQCVWFEPADETWMLWGLFVGSSLETWPHVICQLTFTAVKCWIQPALTCLYFQSQCLLYFLNVLFKTEMRFFFFFFSWCSGSCSSILMCCVGKQSEELFVRSHISDRFDFNYSLRQLVHEDKLNHQLRDPN